MTREVFCLSCQARNDVTFPFGYRPESGDSCPECDGNYITMIFTNT